MRGLSYLVSWQVPDSSEGVGEWQNTTVKHDNIRP